MGIELNRMENGMERKFRYGIWKMTELNGKEDFKNGMKHNLPYFHTNSKPDFDMAFTEKYIRIVINLYTVFPVSTVFNRQWARAN